VTPHRRGHGSSHRLRKLSFMDILNQIPMKHPVLSLTAEAKKTVLLARIIGVGIGIFAVGLIFLTFEFRALQSSKKLALASVNAAVVSILSPPEGEPFLDRKARVLSSLSRHVPRKVYLEAAIRAEDDGALRAALRVGASSIESRSNSLVLFVITAASVLFITGALALALLARRLDSQARLQVEFQNQASASLSELEKAVRYRSPMPTFKKSVWTEIDTFAVAVDRIAKEYGFDRDLLQAGSSTSRLETMLPQLLDIFGRVVPCDRVALAFLDQSGSVMAETAVSKGLPILLNAGFTQRLEETSLGRLVASGEARIISDLEEYTATMPSPASELLLREGYRSSLTVPLMLGDRCVGFLFLNAAASHAYHTDHLALAERMATILKGALYSDYVLQLLLAETSRAFVRTMEKKDDETSFHIRRMSMYSYRIAVALSKKREFKAALPPRLLRDILWYAPLHDIGKIGVPDAVLFKPGALGPGEWVIMQDHVSMGVAIFRSLNEGLRVYLPEPPLDTAIDIIQGHHEKWDGSGYPAGLRGSAIPLSARIVAAGDVLDALTSERPYKSAWSFDQAILWMAEQSGSHFDPAVVDAILTIRSELEGIYQTCHDGSTGPECTDGTAIAVDKASAKPSDTPEGFAGGKKRASKTQTSIV